MSKDIWHTADEIPDFDKSYVELSRSLQGDLVYSTWGHPNYITPNTIKWCYTDDLLALETENKDLSDKIGQLKTELEKTRQELEQSETCCTEWEKQALDYKAENIALSGELERTHKALDIAVDKLKGIKDECYDTTDVLLYVNKALEEITALEKSELENLEMLVNNVFK